MKYPKVSIICPVYNAEVYICDCIDSIVAQKYTDWECLLIDDGSPDNSGKICDEYAKSDSRIKVFHIQNGGVSAARNIGLEHSTGEWVGFVDSDDWVSNDYLDIFFNSVDDYSAIHFGYQKEEDGGNFVNHNSHDFGMVLCDMFFSKRNFSPSSCSYFFRKDIIDSSKLMFRDGLKYSEDTLFITQYLLNVSHIQVLPISPYYYRNNSTSATHNLRQFAHADNDLVVLESLLKQMQMGLHSQGVFNFLFNYQFDNFSLALTFYTRLLTAKQYISLIRRFRYLYRCGRTKYSVTYNQHNRYFYHMPILNMIYRNSKVKLYKILHHER